MRVVAVMQDGTKHETVGAYMALSDRVAFERKYAVSVAELRRETRRLDDPEADVSSLREEHTAFYAWLTLRRGDCPVGDFDAFIGDVDDLTLERLDGPVDPTDPGPLPGTSPS